MNRDEAASLLAAEHSRIPVAPLTTRRPGLSLEDAYRIQAAAVACRIAAGARLVGHKVGVTSEAMQQQMGVDEPDSGVLLNDMVLPSGSELLTGDFMNPRVEAEIAFRLGRDLRGPDVDVEAVRRAEFCPMRARRATLAGSASSHPISPAPCAVGSAQESRSGHDLPSAPPGRHLGGRDSPDPTGQVPHHTRRGGTSWTSWISTSPSFGRGRWPKRCCPGPMTTATPARTATADHRVTVGPRQSGPRTARSTADGPTYRPVLPAVMLRASTYSRAVVPGWWPVLDVDTGQWRSWLAQVAAQREVMEAIAHASPVLAARVTRICRGEAGSPQRARRAAEAVARYLLRLGGRATPCGLFAGVAPVQVGSGTTVSWGVDHQRHSAPAAADMAAAVTAAENDPELLGELRVQANDLTSWRGGRLVVDGMPHLHQDHPAEVSVRAGPVLEAVLAEAAQPTPVLGLVEVITDRFPRATRDGIEAMVQGLVRHGVLISELRAPGTCTTPGTYLHHRLDAVDGTSSQPPSIDLRIDAAIQVPGQVAEEVAEAGRLLALTAVGTSGRRSWRDWHTRFVERFGAGAAVPVSAAVDPVEGVGWPGHLLPDHTPDPQPWQRRDRHLATLAQRAARHGAAEVHLSAADLTALGAETGWAGWAPHLSVCAQIQATSRAELDYGRFDIVVGAVGRTGPALGGRLLDRLPPPQASHAIEALSILPPTIHGAIVAQLSAPARQLDCDPLGRAPQVTRELLHVGEFGDGGLRVADLFVVADSRRLYLVDRDERVVEPMVAHTLAGHTLAPLVRFLGEVSTSALGPVRGFDWGPLVGLPWRPRLRVGRIILSPAAWRLDPADLPGRDASPTQWCAALARHREVEGIPEWVHLGDTDHRLRLNLTHDLDTHQLRLHLDRADGPVTVSQAADDEAWGWIDGHAHELLVPLASSTEPAPRPAVLDRLVVVTGREASLPADGPVLSALIDCDPRAIATLVTQRLPRLAEALDTEELWWLPMRQPRPHLRLRLATDDPSAAAARLSSWVAELRQDGLAGALTFDTFRPEVARYSAGAADPAAAMDAVQAVWTADCATAAVLLETTRDHPELDPDAATAASLLDLTCAALGRDAGLAWLISHRELTGTAPIGDRGAIARAQTLWRDPPRALRQAWARRADAITAYRDRLGGLPGSVLVSLLHLHHVRVHQPDPAGEQARHRVARAVALAAHAPKGTT